MLRVKERQLLVVLDEFIRCEIKSEHIFDGETV
jgi:hypothetical protein